MSPTFQQSCWSVHSGHQRTVTTQEHCQPDSRESRCHHSPAQAPGQVFQPFLTSRVLQLGNQTLANVKAHCKCSSQYPAVAAVQKHLRLCIIWEAGTAERDRCCVHSIKCCLPFSASDSSSGTSPITISPKQCACNTSSNYENSNNARAWRTHQALTVSGNSNREEFKTFLGGHVLLIWNTFYIYWLNNFNRCPGCFDFTRCKAACIFSRCPTPASSLPPGFPFCSLFRQPSNINFCNLKPVAVSLVLNICSQSHPDTAWWI